MHKHSCTLSLQLRLVLILLNCSYKFFSIVQYIYCEARAKVNKASFHADPLNAIQKSIGFLCTFSFLGAFRLLKLFCVKLYIL